MKCQVPFKNKTRPIGKIKATGVHKTFLSHPHRLLFYRVFLYSCISSCLEIVCVAGLGVVMKDVEKKNWLTLKDGATGEKANKMGGIVS